MPTEASSLDKVISTSILQINRMTLESKQMSQDIQIDDGFKLLGYLLLCRTATVSEK